MIEIVESPNRESQSFFESRVERDVATLERLQTGTIEAETTDLCLCEQDLGNLFVDIAPGNKMLIVSLEGIKDLNNKWGHTAVNEAIRFLQINAPKKVGQELEVPKVPTRLSSTFKQQIFLLPSQAKINFDSLRFNLGFSALPPNPELATDIDRSLSFSTIETPEELLKDTNSATERNYLAQRYASFVSRLKEADPEFVVSAKNYLERVEEARREAIVSLEKLFTQAHLEKTRFIDENGCLTVNAFDLVRKKKIDTLNADSEIKDETCQKVGFYQDLVGAVVVIVFYKQGDGINIDTASIKNTAEFWEKRRETTYSNLAENPCFRNKDGNPFLTSETEFHRRSLLMKTAVYYGIEIVGLGSYISVAAAHILRNLSSEKIGIKELMNYSALRFAAGGVSFTTLS